jgi:hypothetical protein
LESDPPPDIVVEIKELLLRAAQPEVVVQEVIEWPPNGRALRPNAVAARIRFWEM